MSEDRTLAAYANGIKIGEVTDSNGVWRFAYDAGWLREPGRFALCPSLPLGPQALVDSSTDRPVQYFFDNLLPEEGQRALLAGAARLDIEDAWGMLAFYGAESAGAITLLAPGQQEPARSRVPLSFADLHQRIQDLPGRPLDARAPKHMSVGGAQHKLAAILVGKPGARQLLEPVGAEPSTHILKPEAKGTAWPHAAINELFCMRLAARAGLPVPATEFLRVPAPVFAIARFDRDASGDAVRRRHVIDGMQLRGRSRTLKYTHASTQTLRALIDLTRTRAAARLGIYRWVVFNLLVGNGDAHMKNLSFFADPDGYSLAPFYDIVSTVVYDTRNHRDNAPYWPDSELSMQIGATRHYRDLRRVDVIQAGQELGLSRAAAAFELDAVIAAVTEHANPVRAEVEAEAMPDGGESRILNAILAMPVKEMSERLRMPGGI
ncbi:MULTISPECIES: HipA domain-containing protein [Cupriavidus]